MSTVFERLTAIEELLSGLDLGVLRDIQNQLSDINAELGIGTDNRPRPVVEVKSQSIEKEDIEFVIWDTAQCQYIESFSMLGSDHTSYRDKAYIFDKNDIDNLSVFFNNVTDYPDAVVYGYRDRKTYYRWNNKF